MVYLSVRSPYGLGPGRQSLRLQVSRRMQVESRRASWTMTTNYNPLSESLAPS